MNGLLKTLTLVIQFLSMSVIIKTIHFSNLYLFLDLTFPNGKNRRDTLGCALADTRGNWFGSGIGDIIDHRISFKENFTFPIEGRYNLRVTQGMRQDPLLGVTDIGFRLETPGD